MRANKAVLAAGLVLLATVVTYGCGKDKVVTPTKTLQSVSVGGVPASLVPPNTATLTATAGPAIRGSPAHSIKNITTSEHTLAATSPI